MRIISGRWRGRRLKTPKFASIRLTSDKVRESLFNIIGDKITGKKFLELFAGGGSVGIEALSRGAEKVVFVEKNPKIVRLLSENLKRLEIESASEIIARDVMIALKYLDKRGDKFSYVFLDPPYRKQNLLKKTLEYLSGLAILEKKCIIIVEYYKQIYLPEKISRLTLDMRKIYGDTVLSFYTLQTEENRLK